MRSFESLRKKEDFSRVYRKGRSRADVYMVVRVIRNDLSENRIGIVVSKKVGNSVIRHRITRLIRESFRLNDGRIKKGFDIVVIARNSAKGTSYFEISDALLRLLKAHGLCDR